MESTLATVCEGHVACALIVNTTGGSVCVKHGVYLGDGLVYDQKVLPTPLAFPTACVAMVQSSAEAAAGPNPKFACQRCGLPGAEALAIGASSQVPRRDSIAW